MREEVDEDLGQLDKRETLSETPSNQKVKKSIESATQLEEVKTTDVYTSRSETVSTENTKTYTSASPLKDISNSQADDTRTKSTDKTLESPSTDTKSKVPTVRVEKRRSLSRENAVVDDPDYLITESISSLIPKTDSVDLCGDDFLKLPDNPDANAGRLETIDEGSQEISSARGSVESPNRTPISSFEQHIQQGHSPEKENKDKQTVRNPIESPELTEDYNQSSPVAPPRKNSIQRKSRRDYSGDSTPDSGSPYKCRTASPPLSDRSSRSNSDPNSTPGRVSSPSPPRSFSSPTSSAPSSNKSTPNPSPSPRRPLRKSSKSYRAPLPPDVLDDQKPRSASESVPPPPLRIKTSLIKGQVIRRHKLPEQYRPRPVSAFVYSDASPPPVPPPRIKRRSKLKVSDIRGRSNTVDESPFSESGSPTKRHSLPDGFGFDLSQLSEDDQFMLKELHKLQIQNLDQAAQDLEENMDPETRRMQLESMRAQFFGRSNPEENIFSGNIHNEEEDDEEDQTNLFGGYDADKKTSDYDTADSSDIVYENVEYRSKIAVSNDDIVNKNVPSQNSKTVLNFNDDVDDSNTYDNHVSSSLPERGDDRWGHKDEDTPVTRSDRWGHKDEGTPVISSDRWGHKDEDTPVTRSDRWGHKDDDTVQKDIDTPVRGSDRWGYKPAEIPERGGDKWGYKPAEIPARSSDRWEHKDADTPRSKVVLNFNEDVDDTSTYENVTFLSSRPIGEYHDEVSEVQPQKTVLNVSNEPDSEDIVYENVRLQNSKIILDLDSHQYIPEVKSGQDLASKSRMTDSQERIYGEQQDTENVISGNKVNLVFHSSDHDMSSYDISNYRRSEDNTQVESLGLPRSELEGHTDDSDLSDNEGTFCATFEPRMTEDIDEEDSGITLVSYHPNKSVADADDESPRESDSERSFPDKTSTEVNLTLTRSYSPEIKPIPREGLVNLTQVSPLEAHHSVFRPQSTISPQSAGKDGGHHRPDNKPQVVTLRLGDKPGSSSDIKQLELRATSSRSALSPTLPDYKSSTVNAKSSPPDIVSQTPYTGISGMDPVTGLKKTGLITPVDKAHKFVQNTEPSFRVKRKDDASTTPGSGPKSKELENQRKTLLDSMRVRRKKMEAWVPEYEENNKNTYQPSKTESEMKYEERKKSHPTLQPDVIPVKIYDETPKKPGQFYWLLSSHTIHSHAMFTFY